jgi:hypothetical protein
MPFDGNGIFNRLYNWQQDDANGINIRADRMDEEFNGIAAALSICLTRDGQSMMEADLDLANNNIKRVKAPTLDHHATTKKYVDDGFLAVNAFGLGMRQPTLLTDFSKSTGSGFYRWSNTTLNRPLELTTGGGAIPFNRVTATGETGVFAWLAMLSAGASAASRVPRMFAATTNGSDGDIIGEWVEFWHSENLPETTLVRTTGNFTIEGNLTLSGLTNFSRNGTVAIFRRTGGTINAVTQWQHDGATAFFGLATSQIFRFGTGSSLATLANWNAEIDAATGNARFKGTLTSDVSFIGRAVDTASAPSFTWTGDLTTGLFRPSSSNVGVSTGGVERFRFTSGGNLLAVGTDAQFLGRSGDSTANPSFSWNGATNSGLYFDSASTTIRVALSGSNTHRFDTNGGLGISVMTRDLADARYARTTADVQALIAGSTSGAIGTWALLRVSNTVSGNVVQGNTVAGSDLFYVNAAGGVVGTNVSPPGTWRAMGRADPSSADFAARTTVFLRIA